MVQIYLYYHILTHMEILRKYFNLLVCVLHSLGSKLLRFFLRYPRLANQSKLWRSLTVVRRNNECASKFLL